MTKLTRPYYTETTKKEFEDDIWPDLEQELRGLAEDEILTPSGGSGPAGGLGLGFDSLSAVIVTEMILPDLMKKDSPPPEFIIKEGGYSDVDEFLNHIKGRISNLCIEDKDEEAEGKIEKVI